MPIEDVIWEAEEHTKAKHRILKGYLDAWAPIMSQWAAKSADRPPLYVDAFAGPGVYKDGSDGSPIVAVKCVLEHRLPLPSPVRMCFIESDPERYALLKGTLSDLGDLDRAKVEVELMNLDCQVGLPRLMAAERAKYQSFASALVFLDQFGYSQAPMELIKEVMAGQSCEVVIYLDYRRMNHTLGDPNKAAALERAFGSNEWKNALDRSGSDRARHLKQLYKTALSRSGAEYVWDFEMRGKRDELLSWLFFCTSSMKGLEEMKEAMGRLDLSGNFRFSDRHVNQLNLLAQEFDQRWLEEHLLTTFSGQTVQLGVVQKHVLTETPMISFRSALGNLETSGRLEVIDAPPGRKKRAFTGLAATTRLRFLPEPELEPEQQSLFRF